MKKQELIHLHGVLAEVVDWVEEADGISVDTKEYEELETRATSIHRSKTAHKDAAFALTEAITAELQVEETDTVAVSAD